MSNYRVSFYKTLLNSSGHNFKCLEQQIDVASDNPSDALVLAQGQLKSSLGEVDRVEVIHMPDAHHAKSDIGQPNATF
ncbi:MAG: hypothetical protein K2X60_05055 [Xanthobacteraceae bacterium]|nr:hypothetical protein [Xanthobacteraceae bacterium]